MSEKWTELKMLSETVDKVTKYVLFDLNDYNYSIENSDKLELENNQGKFCQYWRN